MGKEGTGRRRETWRGTNEEERGKGKFRWTKGEEREKRESWRKGKETGGRKQVRGEGGGNGRKDRKEVGGSRSKRGNRVSDRQKGDGKRNVTEK